MGCSLHEKGETACPITFSSPPGEERLQKYLEHACKTIRIRVSEDLGLTDLGPIQVTIVSTEKDFLAAQPAGKPSHRWAAALAYPSQGKILMKSPKLILGGQPAYEKIFFHEVAHIALHRALSRFVETEPFRSDLKSDGPPLMSLSAPVPHWLHEGYAVYLSRDWSLNREVLLTRASLKKGLIPLGRLVGSFPEDEQEAHLAYAQSADLVHYLIHGYGRERFQLFLKALGQENRFGYACRQAFGIDFFSLEKAWRKHLKKRYSWVPLLGSTGMLWFLASVVFLAAYLRKKMTARAKLARWSEEEPL